MIPILSGREQNLPYSLSRWTDVVGGKWAWFREQLDQGWMVAFDQRTSVPARWSLDPEETLGLMFWTKDPTNLLTEKRLDKYRVKVHVTVTGWAEVEKGAPGLYAGAKLLVETAKRFGPENVVWRFSPVPVLDDVAARFQAIAAMAGNAGIQSVYLSFLQPNDRVPETRTKAQKVRLLEEFADDASLYGVRVFLCDDDKELLVGKTYRNLAVGVCAPPSDFSATTPTDACGCGFAVDPFTVNESCTFGCQYCLDPDTPILYSDLVWRPIGQAQVGDRIVGFDEHPTGLGRGARKLRETVIEAVVRSKRQTVRMVTSETDLYTTAEHRWLNDRGSWRNTNGLWVNRHPSQLKQIGWVNDLPFTDDYRVGYLAGMTLGDGTFRYQPGQRSSPQPYWRVALKDEEPLGRLVLYLAKFGVFAGIRPFDSGPRSATTMSKVEVRALSNLEVLHRLTTNEVDSQDYRRGFLAGFYDAEGSLERSAVLRRISRYAAKLGFSFYEENRFSETVGTCRLEGFLRDRLRFLSTVRPALARKAPEWNGASLLTTSDPLRAKEKGPVREVVDIQTSARTFFAAGLATHNCYAANKDYAPKKRNTTKRSLTLLGK